MATKEPEKQELTFKAAVTPDEAADYLQSVVDGLRQRALLAESGNDSIEMAVATDVQFEVEFSAGGKKSSINIALDWRSQTQEPAPRPTLSVLSGRDMTEREVELSEDHAVEAPPGTNGAHAAPAAEEPELAPPAARAPASANGTSRTARPAKRKPAAQSHSRARGSSPARSSRATGTRARKTASPRRGAKRR